MSCITHTCPKCNQLEFNNMLDEIYCDSCGIKMHKTFDEVDAYNYDIHYSHESEFYE